jgi:hypothetical protein
VFSPRFPPAGFAFLQEFPETFEVLFFFQAEFFVHMFPVVGRVVPEPETCDFNGT